MKNGGGGAPENKLLKGKFLEFALDLLRLKTRIFPYLLEGRALRITKENKIKILRFAQNDMVFRMCTNACHPEDKVRRILIKKNKKCAFTLAEVLITLGIIGIVAAMTIPIMIGKYQKQETMALLKKTYSELNQAIALSEVNNESREYWNYSQSFDDIDFWSLYLVPYIKSSQVKTIRSSSINSDIDPAVEYIQGFQRALKVVLSSGVNLYFWGKYQVLVDLNGNKRPNMFGRDIYHFSLVEPTNANFIKGEGFVPFGWWVWRKQSSAWQRNVFKNGYASYADCGCKYNTMEGPNSNRFCAALIMMDNWEIKKDYPW